jgi:hypothetical protein
VPKDTKSIDEPVVIESPVGDAGVMRVPQEVVDAIDTERVAG